MNTTKKKLLSLLNKAYNAKKKHSALALIEEARLVYPDLSTIFDEDKLYLKLPDMIKWVENMPEQSDSEKLKEYTVSDKLKKVLIATHNTGADYIVFPPNTFEDEYLLPNDDKSYVIFHKQDTDPNIIDKLDVNKQPKSINVWKNWVMTITYHA